MQRLIAVLYLAVLFTVPGGVHRALVDTPPRSPMLVAVQPQSPTPVAAQPQPSAPVSIQYLLPGSESVRPPATPDGAAGGVDSAMGASPPAPVRAAEDRQKPPSASAAPQPFSLDGLIYNLRGLWSTDINGTRVARVDRGPVPRQSAVLPILMYHHVQPIDFAQSTAFASDLTLPPAEFERELRYLRDRGFQSPSLEDLSLYLQGRKDLPRLSVVLTFDDGYLDNYLYAFPLLARYGFTGTFFIITGSVGQRDYVAWWQVRDMAAAGMEIGSHTISHPDLSASLPTQREKELTESKRVLEDALGKPVRVLSYPSGAYSPDVMAATRKAGYVAAVTTKYGATHDSSKPLELARVRIHGTDALSVFRWRIEQYLPGGDPETK